MKRTTPRLAALCGIILSFFYTASAQSPQLSSRADPAPKATASNTKADKAITDAASPASEVETLKRRVEEIENQNRLLMQIVTELKARLDSKSLPEDKRKEAATATASQPSISTTSPPTTSPATSQSAQPDKNPPVRWSELIGEGNRLKFYGFLRLDLDFDTQHPNNTQIPLFITSPDPAAGGTENGDFSMHPRLTRFGIDYTGPRIENLGDARLSGKLETDFENGGSESRQIIRIRHAYLRMDWTDFSLLAGQTWDVVSPLFPTVNNDSLQWNAGNVGDRRPQLRAAYEPKARGGKFSLIGGIGLTGAISALVYRRKHEKVHLYWLESHSVFDADSNRVFKLNLSGKRRPASRAEVRV